MDSLRGSSHLAVGLSRSGDERMLPQPMIYHQISQSTPPATRSLRSEGRKATDPSGQPGSDLDLRGEEG